MRCLLLAPLAPFFELNFPLNLLFVLAGPIIDPFALRAC